MPELLVRPYRPNDATSIIALWNEVLPSSNPWNDPATQLKRKVDLGDELLLVGEHNETIVAVVIAGYDGIRGWIYGLAVATDQRQNGFGRAILQAAENELLKRGCPKINLQVRADNLEVLQFYRKCGYATEDRASLGKPLPPFDQNSNPPLKPTTAEVKNEIRYQLEPHLSPNEFVDVLQRSTLAERRPIDEADTIKAMLNNAQVILTARSENQLVGISRAISDFAYSTYLSDLAVDVTFQRRGIGRELIRRTHEAAGLNTTLILLAAPAAADYYPHIGMTHAESCWITPRTPAFLTDL